MSNDAPKHLPKYRKHKRSGNALVVLNGREIYLGKHGSKASIEKYDRLIAEWIQSGRQSWDSKLEITVAEVMAAYCGAARKTSVKVHFKIDISKWGRFGR
jgi:hypothetical protein